MPNGIPQNGLSYLVQRLSTTIQGRGGGLNPSEKYESVAVTWHKNLPEWTVIKFHGSKGPTLRYPGLRSQQKNYTVDVVF